MASVVAGELAHVPEPKLARYRGYGRILWIAIDQLLIDFIEMYGLGIGFWRHAVMIAKGSL